MINFVQHSSKHSQLRYFLMLVVSLFCIVLSAHAAAGDCRVISQSCIEGAETRNIAGNMIYKACWRFRSQYECLKPDSVNYCEAISKVAGCWQTSTSCVATSWNGVCLTEQRTYRCDNPATPTPTNTVKLDGTYTIIKDELDQSQCEPQAKKPTVLFSCTYMRGTW